MRPLGNPAEDRGIFCFDNDGLDLAASESYLLPFETVSRIRFTEVPDQFVDQRREHLVSIFGAVGFHELSMSSLRGIAQHDSTFEALLCSVDDVARLRAILIPPADRLVKRKVSFAYSARTSPGRRAALLRFGFDDVFHAGMSSVEIRLRVGWVFSRASVYRTGTSLLIPQEWESFCADHVVGTLGRSQRRIVQTLLAARGQAVKFSELANYDYVEQDYKIASLKVIISNIRKKLKNCEIVPVRGEGYALVIAARHQNLAPSIAWF